MTELTPPTYVCGTCLRGIARVTDENGNVTGFIHPFPNEGDIDHETDPVIQSEAGLVDEVCDFCNAPDVSWVEYAEPFSTTLADGRTTYEDDGQWASCEECHEYIESKDVKALIERSASRMERVVGPGMKDILRKQLSATHQMFWTNMTNTSAKVVVRP